MSVLTLQKYVVNYLLVRDIKHNRAMPKEFKWS
jgi:hypothetical protein